MGTNKFMSYDNLVLYDTEIKQRIDYAVSNKQDKILVVTKGSDGLASHTPAEILECVQNGGKAVYNDGATEHAFLEGNSSISVFYSSFINASKIQFTICQIMSDKTIDRTTSSYVPPVASVNGKTGSISLSASDVGADLSGSAAQALDDANTYTDNAISGLVNGDSIPEITSEDIMSLFA